MNSPTENEAVPTAASTSVPETTVPASAEPTLMETPSQTPTPQPSPAPTPTKTLRCLFLGDSTFSSGTILNRLLELQANSPLKLQSIGSCGKRAIKHEGRPGWSVDMYMTKSKVGDISNSFYNQKTKTFDFSQYMAAKQFDGVDYVFINLGINDVFFYRSDKALQDDLPLLFGEYDQMVASIHAYDKAIRVAVCVTIPPTDNAKEFQSIYADRQTLARYERNNTIWAEELVRHFTGRESENVFLVNIRDAIDRKQIVGVHPNGKGYCQIAEAIWSWLAGREGYSPPAPR